MPDTSPPSAGKTVVIGGTVAIACQNLMFIVGHNVWGLDWMSQDVAGDIMVIAVALAGWIMHDFQRKNERLSTQPQTGGTP